VIPLPIERKSAYKPLGRKLGACAGFPGFIEHAFCPIKSVKAYRAAVASNRKQS
jgi:hypothetical protein